MKIERYNSVQSTSNDADEIFDNVFKDFFDKNG